MKQAKLYTKEADVICPHCNRESHYFLDEVAECRHCDKTFNVPSYWKLLTDTVISKILKN